MARCLTNRYVYGVLHKTLISHKSAWSWSVVSSRVSSLCSFQACNLTTKTENGNTTFNKDTFKLVYEGPLSRQLSMLKMFSLSTASVSLVAGPYIVFFGNSISLIGKLFLASTIMTMGVTTTILLHFMSRVYVYKIYFEPHTKIFAAETSTIFAGKRLSLFSVSDIVVPELEEMFSTFQANGSKYFLHTDLKEADQIMNYVKEYNLERLEQKN